MRVITFKIDDELLDALDRYCIRWGISRSKAIRTAIELLIQYDEKIYMKEKMKMNIRKIILT